VDLSRIHTSGTTLYSAGMAFSILADVGMDCGVGFINSGCMRACVCGCLCVCVCVQANAEAARQSGRGGRKYGGPSVQGKKKPIVEYTRLSEDVTGEHI
jgi:hypothetical protein